MVLRLLFLFDIALAPKFDIGCATRLLPISPIRTAARCVCKHTLALLRNSDYKVNAFFRNMQEETINYAPSVQNGDTTLNDAASRLMVTGCALNGDANRVHLMIGRQLPGKRRKRARAKGGCSYGQGIVRVSDKPNNNPIITQ